MEQFIIQKLFFTKNSSTVRSLAFSNDESLLACGEDNPYAISIWDTSNEIKRVLQGHLDTISQIQFNGDGKGLTSASYDGTVKFWDTEAGVCVRTLDTGRGAVVSMVLSSTQEILARGNKSGSVELWEIATGNHICDIADVSEPSVLKFIDGDKFIVGIGESSTIRFWSVKNGKVAQEYHASTPQIRSIACSSNGMYLATAGVDTSVKLIELRTGKIVSEFGDANASATSVMFSADNKLLACSYYREDFPVKLWDIASGVDIKMNDAETDEAHCTVFSARGNFLACGGGGRPGGTHELWRLVR
jgi:WD40 repeat protein